MFDLNMWLHGFFRYVHDDVPVPPSLVAPSKDGIYIVPKGNFVLISPSMSQVDPSIWKDGDNLIMGLVLLVKEWKVLISLLALTFF